jgi:two-component system, OmpR family, osmolarity sensor histidine kinase EnvZ
MSRLQRFVPRTLFGRNLLLIAALILFVELGIALVFSQMVQESRAARTAELVRQQALALRGALETMTPAQRAAFIARLEREGEPDIALNQQPAGLVEPRHLLARAFLARMARRLPGYEVAWQELPERRLWLRTDIDGARYWLGFDARAMLGNVSSLFLAVSIVAGLMAALGAALIQRHINRPLDALADAAGSVAARLGGAQPETIHIPRAPQEIARVAASFNSMLRDLGAAEQERVLMLAGVSHDLRTPLSKLRLATELLSPHAEPELIDSMKRNIAAADAVIGQFIDFARIGSDEALHLCDLDELAHDIARSADPARVRVEPGRPPALLCRPVALRRAVLNLVENALRYAAPEQPGVGAQIVLRTGCDGTTIVIAVLDNGAGVPAAELERLRQPFARLERSRSGHPGAGLGLAIVERIARLHHGELLLGNRPEGGFEAQIRLPLGHEDQSATSKHQGAVS